MMGVGLRVGVIFLFLLPCGSPDFDLGWEFDKKVKKLGKSCDKLSSSFKLQVQVG